MGPNNSVDRFIDMIRTIGPDEVVEFMCHPGTKHFHLPPLPPPHFLSQMLKSVVFVPSRLPVCVVG